MVECRPLPGLIGLNSGFILYFWLRCLVNLLECCLLQDDYHQEHVTYTCQDGLAEGMEDLKGFFDVPATEEEWPKCVLGRLESILLM